MKFDLMTGNLSWQDSAALAARLEDAGFSGMLFTETSQVPWMMIAAAAQSAPSLEFSTGIAVAFPRSPMVSAQVAWELAGNTGGRFRLGLGSQVKAHVTRRYGAEFDRPAARMRDYVLAVKACLAAFRGESRLDHDGPFYALNLLRPEWIPPTHDHGDVRWTSPRSALSCAASPGRSRTACTSTPCTPCRISRTACDQRSRRAPQRQGAIPGQST